MSGLGGSNGGGKSPGAAGGANGGMKRETVYSDRFVPSRSASAGLQGFNLLDSAQPPASTSHPPSEREVSVLFVPTPSRFHFSSLVSFAPLTPHPPGPRHASHALRYRVRDLFTASSEKSALNPFHERMFRRTRPSAPPPFFFLIFFRRFAFSPPPRFIIDSLSTSFSFFPTLSFSLTAGHLRGVFDDASHRAPGRCVRLRRGFIARENVDGRGRS